MGLISREAAIEALGERPENWTDSPEELEAVRAYDNAVDNLKAVPSVPAVPLDKLCEYLNSVIYPCIICKESPGPQCNAKRKGCWNRALTKWMEEQNATD